MQADTSVVRADNIVEDYDFSVIVPTRNESINLPRLLASIVRQEGVTIQTIVVDESSTDDTCEIATRFCCKIVHRQHPGFYSPPSESRNLGAVASQGRILVHLDADMELPSSDVLFEVKMLLSDAVQAAVLHERDVASGYWSRVKAVERRCYWGSPIESARVVSRSAFVRVGGYDANISSGEDFCISAKLQTVTDIGRSHGITVLHHIGSPSLVNLIRKKFSYGRAATAYVSEVCSARDGRASAMITTYTLCYLRHWRFIISDPLHYLGIFILRPLEVGALISGLCYQWCISRRNTRVQTG